MKMKTLTISIAMVLGIVCLCAGAVVTVAVALNFVPRGGTPVAGPTLSPDQLSTELAAIEAFVIAERGLEPSGQTPVSFMTVEEVRQRTIDEFNEDTSPEEMADSVLVLSALGLMRPDVDLYDLYIRIYSEGVSGFYDPDEKEMVLVSEAQDFNVLERVVYAHEYVHALQDQVFGIRESGFSEEMFDSDPERALAIQAVLEGDASLLDQQFLDSLNSADQRAYDALVSSADVSIYREMPQFLLYDFFFPYDQGLAFVERYYDQGGWAAVDALWDDPPVSTEHILHPERYEAGDLPVIVARPALTDTLGSGWRWLDDGVTGEWYTYLILAHGEQASQRLNPTTAERAAEGWGGDSYVVYYSDDRAQVALAIHWVWDTTEDAAEFAAAFEDYGGRRFGEASGDAQQICWTAAQVNCLFVGGLNTLWLMSPDPATMELLRDAYPDF